MIRLDCTTISIVIVCETCGVWHAFAFDKLDAWTRAADHEKRAHPGDTQAQDALSELKRKMRHAV
ncbi:hypothetical protein M0722_01535 [Microbacterium sp. KSW4-16]|jgi:hypothetical protein|uniref:hypothetical protein n=1 Tax=Microbacterium aurugineum TaxID=2851642 RepID=UPI0020C00E71|nr:hypothetical protein [Microbacterium aurugineum]MCK8465864.1 hypothetical protein [Microbacterium aurugineum]